MSVEFNENVGVSAGKVWASLNESGQASATKLAEATGLDRNDV
jgi:hypothetical protein